MTFSKWIEWIYVLWKYSNKLVSSLIHTWWSIAQVIEICPILKIWASCDLSHVWVIKTYWTGIKIGAHAARGPEPAVAVAACTRRLRLACVPRLRCLCPTKERQPHHYSSLFPPLRPPLLPAAVTSWPRWARAWELALNLVCSCIRLGVRVPTIPTSPWIASRRAPIWSFPPLCH